jgi:HSP20 family protein
MPNKSWFQTSSERNRDGNHLRGLKTHVDSLFEDWFGRNMGGVLAPRVDIAEDERYVTLTAELPGVNERDVEVSLVGDQLTIKGEKRSEHEDKAGAAAGLVVHRVERSYGAFQRTLTVPYEINPDEVTALFNDGVLKITLPKPANAAVLKDGHRIEVNKSANFPSATPAPASTNDLQQPGSNFDQTTAPVGAAVSRNHGREM